jgi:UPF0755 protein
MTEPGAPRRGRHASPDDGGVGLPTSSFAIPPRSIPVQPGAGHLLPNTTEGWGWATPGSWVPPVPAGPLAAPARPLAGPARPPVPGPAGPAPVPATTEPPPGRAPAAGDAGPLAAGRVHAGLLEDPRLPAVPSARHRPGDGGTDPARGTGPLAPTPRPAGYGAGAGGGTAHPSAPLPPFPPSAWSRLAQIRAADAGDGTRGDAAVPPTGPLDDDTQAAEGLHLGGLPDEHPRDEHHRLEHHDLEPHEDDRDEHDGGTVWDATGGLDVIGAHVEGQDPDTDVHPRALDDTTGLPAGHDQDADDLHHDLHDEQDDEDGPLLLDDDAPATAADTRRTRRRRRRRHLAVLVSLVVLGGLALGIVLGGRQVLGLVDPPDWTGTGTGTAQIRVEQGDSLKAIGQTMVDGGVIASVRPFVKAAEANPQATSISPGTYALRKHMSGRAALDLLLQPASRLVSRVTLPEGLTAAVTLQKVAQTTGTPLAQLQAAAADPAAIGLPAYAGGKIEGFLFPATYDFEPGTTPTQMLQAMVARTDNALDELAVPEDQRLQVLTEASIVQAEGKTPDDMAKIARVLDNRIAIGMPLQLDTTVNYANGKNGVTTTAQDRANPSPYNTYVHPGLPPGPISNPGEDALRAVLAPAQGSWLYFVVVNPDTGETRFATTPQEAQANTALFQQWLREHPGR